MRKLLLSVLFLAFFLPSFSQQDPQFSQNMYNRLFPNPGVAGSNNAICANLIGRQQWAGFDGAPKSYLFSVHAPIKEIYGGAGLSVLSDRLGPEKTFGLKAAYAYRRNIGPGAIGIGIAGGFVNKSIGNDWRSVDDHLIDEAIPNIGASDTGFDMDLGVYYKTDKMYVGFSTSHLNQTELAEVGSDQGNSIDFSYRIARHYYVMAGYSYDKLDPRFELQPSVFIKSDAASTQIDINMNVVYNKLAWAGVSWRHREAIVPMIGVFYDKLGPGIMKFGYSYDITTSMLRRHNSGTHEIMLGYCFSIIPASKLQRHKTVRFL